MTRFWDVELTRTWRVFITPAPAPNCGVGDVDCGYAKRYVLVTIDIQNASANMIACMEIDVNLNDSIVECISFKMSRTDDCGMDYGVSSAGAESQGV